MKGNVSLVTYFFCVQKNDLFVYEVIGFLITSSFLMMVNLFWMLWFWRSMNAFFPSYLVVRCSCSEIYSWMSKTWSVYFFLKLSAFCLMNDFLTSLISHCYILIFSFYLVIYFCCDGNLALNLLGLCFYS